MSDDWLNIIMAISNGLPASGYSVSVMKTSLFNGPSISAWRNVSGRLQCALCLFLSASRGWLAGFFISWRIAVCQSGSGWRQSLQYYDSMLKLSVLLSDEATWLTLWPSALWLNHPQCGLSDPIVLVIQLTLALLGRRHCLTSVGNTICSNHSIQCVWNVRRSW